MRFADENSPASRRMFCHKGQGVENGKIRDEEFNERGDQKEMMRKEVAQVVKFVKEMVFPKIR